MLPALLLLLAAQDPADDVVVDDSPAVAGTPASRLDDAPPLDPAEMAAPPPASPPPSASTPPTSTSLKSASPTTAPAQKRSRDSLGLDGLQASGGVGCGVGGLLTSIATGWGAWTFCSNYDVCSANNAAAEQGLQIAAVSITATGPVTAAGAAGGMVLNRLNNDRPVLPVVLGAAPGCLIGAGAGLLTGLACSGVLPDTADNSLAGIAILGGLSGAAIAGPAAIAGAAWTVENDIVNSDVDEEAVADVAY